MALQNDEIPGLGREYRADRPSVLGERAARQCEQTDAGTRARSFGKIAIVRVNTVVVEAEAVADEQDAPRIPGVGGG